MKKEPLRTRKYVVSQKDSYVIWDEELIDLPTAKEDLEYCKKSYPEEEWVIYELKEVKLK